MSASVKPHRHSYGEWTLSRSPIRPRPELDDKEYIKSIMLEPMWQQSCSCGFRNVTRRGTKPNVKFKFNDHWNRGRYGRSDRKKE